MSDHSPIIPVNQVKKIISEGKLAVGTFIAEIRQATVTQLIAAGGLDFVMIDNEHGQFPPHSIAQLCTVARYAKITPFVRVPDYAYAQIAQSQDAGAQGLIFPRIETADQVRECVRTARYPPLGIRGNATNRNYCDFRVGNVTAAMNTHNSETLLIFQVETKEAVQNIDEILQIEGCDGVLIGPNDLSISFGCPGQMDNSLMINAFETVLAKCKQYGKIPGCHINDPHLAGKYAAKGFRFVSSSSDTMMLQQGAAAVNEIVKKAAGQAF